MAKLGVEYKLPPEDFKDWNSPANKAHLAEFDRLLEVSSNLPDGEIVGSILRFPRGDGYAFYLVSSIKPLTLRHINYSDNWTVEPALIRGLRLSDVKRMVEGERALERIFRKNFH